MASNLSAIVECSGLSCLVAMNGAEDEGVTILVSSGGENHVVSSRKGHIYKGPFTLGGIPDGIPHGIALVQSAIFRLFLRDT